MSYLLDANVFIQAKNLHYSFEFCPAFWDWLLASNESGQVFSIDKIADELASGDDELTRWADQLDPAFFLPTDAAAVSCIAQVSTWINRQGYEPAAVSTFFQVADLYLIAHALAGEHVVVTHEVPSNSLRRIKIPNVCAGLGVRFTTPYVMLARERARFVLATGPS